LSRITRNKMLHAINGNNTRLSKGEIALLFAAYTKEMNTEEYGRYQRMKDFVTQLDPAFQPHRKTVKRWYLRFEENGGTFCTDEIKKVTSGPSKLSPLGKKSVVVHARGSNYRQTARDFNFQGVNGGMVSVSRQTIKRFADRAGLELSEPVETRIRAHFPHHERLRTLFTRNVSQSSNRFCTGFAFSDEMLWPVTFGFNKKNDVILVERGTQKNTNIIRRTKGDGAQAFSSFIMIDQYGFICSHLFTEKFTIDFWHNLLVTVVKPAIEKRISEHKPFTAAVHDWVTNSGRLFDKEKMDDCFGIGKWLPHTPKICRVEDGFIRREATDLRVAHNRKRMSPAPVCECEVKQPSYPSASPDLNFAENVQGYLKQLVREKIRRKRVTWSGSVKKKMQLLQDVIDELDNNKEYFTKLLGTVKKRYRWVANHNGALYDA